MAPGKEQLDLLMNAFSGGVLYFTPDDRHSQTDRVQDPALLISLIRKARHCKKYIPVLIYNSTYMKNKDYKQAVDHIFRETKCISDDVSLWWEDFPMPDQHGFADEKSFDGFVAYSEKPKTRTGRKIFRLFFYYSFVIATSLLPKRIMLKLKVFYERISHPFNTENTPSL
jgi:hypothetical protein